MVSAGANAFIRIFLVLVSWLVVYTTANSAPDKEELVRPMWFALVRSNIPGCEPNCPQWIYAEGEIKVGTAAKFRKFVNNLGGTRYPLIVSSPGGSVDDAMEMGLLARKLKMDVGVGLTMFAGCSPPAKDCRLSRARNKVYPGIVTSDNAYCISACPLLLAGGVNRLAGWESTVMVHQIYSKNRQVRERYRIRYKIVNGRQVEVSRKLVSRKQIGETTSALSDKKEITKIRRYLSDNGVSDEFFDILSSVPYQTLQRVSWSDRKRLGLITSDQSSETLVSAESCKRDGKLQSHCPALTGKQAEVFARGTIEPGEFRFPSRPGMTFAVVRQNDSLCEPVCPHWYAAQGWILPGSADRFREFIASVGSSPYPLLVHSPGGDTKAAIELGRAVREAGLRVVIANTVFSNTYGPNYSPYREGLKDELGALCMGPCLAVLAGGVHRYASVLPAMVPLHMQPGSFEKFILKNKIAGGTLLKLPDADVELLRAHLREMGIDPALLLPEHQIPFTHSTRIDRRKMEKSGLVDLLQTDDRWVGPAVCNAKVPPPNCVRI